MIKDLHNKLINKEITAVALAEEYFAAIEKNDKDIFAYLTLTRDLALEQARMVDGKIARGEEIGILEGIPGVVKDNLCVAGVRTTAASKILDNYIAPYDATAVARLKEAGAVILGKANMDEFAMGSSTEHSAYGPTKNPVDLGRVPGGSSGGSAAAVAAGEAVWALGTDTGGSIRQPASFCGVVGLKPTYGRVSRYGAIAMASSLDQIGPITKTVEDAAIVLSVISGEDKMDSTSAQSPAKDYTKFLTGSVAGMKIGVVKGYADSLGEEAKASFEKVVEKYKELGAEIQEIELPNVKYSLPVYYIIMPCEVSSNLARFDGVKYGMRAVDHKNTVLDFEPENRTLIETYLDSRRYGLGAETKRRIMLGTYALSSGYYDAYYLRAQKVRTLIKRDFEKAFEEVDLILTPTTPSPAFKFGEKSADPIEMYLEDVFTITANIVGVPAISVPGPLVEVDGKLLPQGFQLSAKWFDEENLLRAAHTYEIN
ncbi:MAG: Asp-tRNA(Asn)/Glu-tRNA(Gln) amidotransferase subunit GatA [Candidatus Moranbacteria bacterium]|nr:Asp-tRNA(Asn)/Glu-tRNA(Gln) amidotransferase subunit GatA [bacterium]MDP1834019.1 Asp-tRNA(Asn)/Glu-tRNA(Gln) amidotransferase subunit GatA [Candidatus Moranbacteria bacterium]